MTKLLKSALVTLLMTFCCTMKAETIRYATDEGFVYSLNTETQEASLNQYSGEATEVVVPEFVTYEGKDYKVTSLGAYCFYDRSSLTSIEIPASVTSLGDYFFYDRSSLESIVVDANNPVYDSREGCNAIIETESNTMIAGCKSTRIPLSVTSLGNYCFEGCSSLTAIEIPTSVTTIYIGCFKNCSSLTAIEIPSSVTRLENSCFSDCSSLESIVVDANNPVYDSREGCNAIIETESNTMIAGCKNTKIPSSVTRLGNYCFEGCSSLTAIEIPTSVKRLGYRCFSGCSSLTSIEIPTSVTRLEDRCFYDCSSLMSIEIPASVTNLGWSCCFEGCSSLESITVDANNSKYDSRENCNAIIETASNTMITGCKNTRIPSSVTSLGDCCFSGCSSLTSIEIPSSVTSLGRWCFYGCSRLTSIEIPSSVTNLGDDCFSGCSSLTSINIPSSVTSLGYCFFEGCTSLTSIEIPASVTSLGSYCFRNCTSLTSIELPASVTSLGGSCFFGCSNLTSIVSKIKEPFEVSFSDFYNISPTCTLTIPYGKREAYMTAGWTGNIFGGGIVEAPYNPASDNYLTLSNAEVCKGCSVVMPVNLYNPEAVTALQFDLSLPDGVTLSDCLLTNRMGADHIASHNRLENDDYRVVAISLSKQNFLGSEGVLLKLSLDVDGDVPSGDYPVIVSNIELTTSDTQPVNPDDVRATLTVSDVKIADANGDGRISITDAVAIVGHILGESVEGFATAAADVNGDGKISITDAVAVVDMILDGNASAKTRDTRAWLDPQ